MKRVLHVTEELSKKNYSISSLIFFLSDYIEKKIDTTHTILTTNLQSEIFSPQHNVEVINLPLLKNFFKINEIISKIIKNIDVIHIHGLWRWINFLSVFHCIVSGKVFYIHPHGMLLKAALRNKGHINFIIKRIVIFFYKIIINNKVNFISITDKESLSIQSYFNKSNLKFIPNPIPFNLGKNEDNEITKTFVFFGRLHPIKNLELMIESFKRSNLDKKWELHIYGIEDDDDYLQKLKNLIKNFENIKIKKPIFGDRKQKVLNSSWANILLSKSEVLSLSVLESASMELPSIVSEEIQIDQFTTNEGVSVKPNTEEISKKIIEISDWSLEERKQKGKRLKQFIEKKFSIDVIGDKYFEIYDSTEKKIDSKGFNFFYFFSKMIREYSIFNTSLAYIFNLMIPTFTMVALVISGNAILGAEVALIASLWLTLTQIFSNNIRAQAIAKNDSKFLNDNIIFRFILAFLAIFLIVGTDVTSILTKSTNNHNILELISITILFQWIFELVITSYEIKKKTLKIIFVNILNTLFILFLLFTIFILDLEILKFVFSIYLIFMALAIFMETQKKMILNMTNYYRLILNNIRSVAFFSSFSIIFSSFVWRYLIFIFYPKEIAAIFFACFSVGSFPATIFNSSIGPSFVKQKTKLSKNLKITISILFILTICVSIFSIINLNLDTTLLTSKNSFTLHTLSFSIIGSFLMTYAMYLRQKKIQIDFKSRDKTFWLDTIYGSLITVILPILYFFNSVYYVSLTFFLASITGLTLYGLFLRFRSNVPSN